jgi:hypothetical protein
VGLSLPGTLVFDYPTMAAIVAFLQTKLPAATASLKAEDDTLATIPPAMYASLPQTLLPPLPPIHSSPYSPPEKLIYAT